MRIGMVTGAVAAVALLAAGCGATGPTGTGSGSGTATVAADAPLPKTGCGSMPTLPIRQEGGVVSALPKDQQAAYEGYPAVTKPTPWADWKPSHPGPYTVAVVWGPSTNDFQAKVIGGIKDRLQASPDVKKVLVTTTGSEASDARQLTNFQAAMNSADIIVLEPLISQSFYSIIERAAKKDIPTIVVNLTTDTPHAINVGSNLVQAALGAAAHTAVNIGGKGNVFSVLGIPGLEGDNQIQGAYDLVLKRCPGIKKIGETSGAYTTAGGKSATLQFLATHPQPIAAVMQTALMAPGIMSAFQQTGRPVPTMPDMGNMAASLSYWKQHRDIYRGSGSGLGAPSLGLSAARVALRMLEGQGPKVNNLLTLIPIITDKNLDEWAPAADLPLSDSTNTEGPKDGFMTDTYMNAFFQHPATPR